MNEQKLKYSSIETFGTQDGPGIRFVLFLQGCNLRCIYCHNPETWSCNKGKEISINEILEKVENQRCYFGKKGGVTISGGEPMLQARELLSLFKELKLKNINIAIDTNATILNDDVKELLKFTDLVLVDIKAICNDVYQKITYTKLNTSKQFEFIDYLESIKKSYWIRYVLTPNMNSDEKQIEKIGKYISKLQFLERFDILPYHTMSKEKYEFLNLEYKAEDIEIPNVELIKKTESILKKYFENIYVK